MEMIVRLCAVFLFFGINLPACHSDDGGSAARKYSLSKGGNQTMKTYYMGRFALDVPVEMKQAVQAQTLRGCEIAEFSFSKEANREAARQDLWNKHQAEVNSLDKPENVLKTVIEERDSIIKNRWSKAMFYYGNYISNREGTWKLFVDYGTTGVWFKYSGLRTKKEEMFNWIVDIAKSYLSRKEGSVLGNYFYLKYGAINLPYFAQEETYSRFEGHPLALKLEVEMDETHEVEKLGMADRLAASLATGFAPGVRVDKIRSRSRTAAGLRGEELVMRMSASGEDTQIQFSWEYRGEVESGERPEIQLTMETSDGNMNEKLKIWDAILDSFKPMYR